MRIYIYVTKLKSKQVEEVRQLVYVIDIIVFQVVSIPV